jgi:hypothetical protein
VKPGLGLQIGRTLLITSCASLKGMLFAHMRYAMTIVADLLTPSLQCTSTLPPLRRDACIHSKVL